jgi:hypothetical protein
VKLKGVNHGVIDVTIPSSVGVTASGGCDGVVGVMDIGQWDNFLQTQLMPFVYTNDAVTPTHLPVFLLYNVVLESGGGCCILGYHGAFSSSKGIQTYSTADYDSSQLFSDTSDMSVLSHEVGDWVDDPFGNNATPAWGHTGQVSGCQNNLEVGDPLSGAAPLISIKMGNGVTYHAQELAFFSWFYRQSPSVGLGGWFSSRGTFTTSQSTVCS